MLIKKFKSHYLYFLINFSIIFPILLFILNFSSKSVGHVKYYESFEYVKEKGAEEDNHDNFNRLVYLIHPIKELEQIKDKNYIKVYFNKYNSWIRIEKYNKSDYLVFKVDNLARYESNYKEIHP